MSAVPAASRAASSAPLLSIGQVLARLNPEFPDLSPSKLRFLEDRGLVSPARTTSGYRKFSHADLERVRLILSMQRDYYLPLKVIRSYLDDFDAGREPALPGGVSLPPTSILPADRRRRRDELIAETGATATLLRDAVSAGLLPASETYGDEAVSVLRSLAELRRSGIEPRHIRHVKTAADRDVALIESAIAPAARRTDAASRAKSLEAARELAAQLESLRAGLVRAELSSW